MTKCPRCELNLTEKTYEGLAIEACQNCGGVWVDANRIQSIVSRRYEHFPKALIEKTLQEAHIGIPKTQTENPNKFKFTWNTGTTR